VKPFGYADVEAYNNIPDSGSNKYKNMLLCAINRRSKQRSQMGLICSFRQWLKLRGNLKSSTP
jgi:hypothetical protein